MFHFIFRPAEAPPANDYSTAGLEERVVIERKSLQDFAQTVIRSR